MNELLKKLIKNSTIKDSSVLTESRFFNEKDVIPTSVPALNIAFSGRLDGGLSTGLTTWAGPSKHFKTLFSLVSAKAYMEKYEDAIMMFFDSEFGTPIAYFDSLNIDKNRVIHIPLTDIEQLKFEIMKQLELITREDKVIIVVDSIGNMASKKEVEDALSEKSTADMTRAKQIKSLFRMVTPHLTMKDIPMLVVNHTYKTMELYSKDVVGGGTGSYYSSDNIFIIGRQQEKEGTEVTGYNFIINVEKSRHTKEKSKIPISVRHEGGISRWSGLLDIAQDIGFVVKPSNGWYSRVNPETGEVEDKKWRAKETNSSAFWNMLLESPNFKEKVRQKYQVSSGSLLSDEVIDNAIEGVESNAV